MTPSTGLGTAAWKAWPVIAVIATWVTVALLWPRDRGQLSDADHAVFRQRVASLEAAKTEQERYYLMGEAALALAMEGKMELAERYAHELLAMSGQLRVDWNYGNAVHEANTVLGLAALKRGDNAEARRRLLGSARVRGSPQLNTYGPTMALARELLLIGEREVVLEFLELCGRFWESDRGRIDRWMKEIRSGRLPDFGANLY